jgi:hypothetical protein
MTGFKELEDGKLRFVYHELRDQVVESPYPSGSVGTSLPDLMVNEWY